MTTPHQPVSLEELTTTMYRDLKARSIGLMHQERGGHTLTPTALLSECVARLLEHDQRIFNNRAHLLAAGALAMRRILVEHARAKGRQRRGGGRDRLNWEAVTVAILDQSDPDAILDLDDALERLRSEPGEHSARYARIAELRLFGMTAEEIAAALDVSLSTVEKDWKFVKAKLKFLLGPPCSS